MVYGYTGGMLLPDLARFSTLGFFLGLGFGGGLSFGGGLCFSGLGFGLGGGGTSEQGKQR